jgi:anti-anti-sigma regulatory factor
MRESSGSSDRMRVTIQQSTGEIMTLTFEGKFAGLQVPELSQACLELTPVLGTKKLLVDRQGVTHVDSTGLALLAEIHSRTGAELAADTHSHNISAEEAWLGFRSRSEH